MLHLTYQHPRPGPPRPVGIRPPQEIANFRHARPSHYAALSASQRSDLDAAAALVRSLDAGLGAAGSHVPVAEAEVPRDWVADGRWEVSGAAGRVQG